MNNFTELKLNFDSLDIYYVRKSILNRLKENSKYFHGTFLDLGCGHMPYRSLLISTSSKITKYIGLDLDGNSLYNKVKPDLIWDGKTIPLPDNSVDSIMATEVFEHIFYPQLVLKEISRVLKTGGYFFFTVPFLWPLHDVPFDAYRYTPFSMQKHLEETNFNIIELKALGGWHASFAQMIGLYTKRAPISATGKRILSVITLPIIKYLIHKDVIESNFDESLMITGFSGTVIKS